MWRDLSEVYYFGGKLVTRQTELTPLQSISVNRNKLLLILLCVNDQIAALYLKQTTKINIYNEMLQHCLFGLD